VPPCCSGVAAEQGGSRRGSAEHYSGTEPEHIATAIAEELPRDIAYLDVESDGAERAAALIAELL
jgi:hypothetical protein